MVICGVVYENIYMVVSSMLEYEIIGDSGEGASRYR